VSYLYKSLIQLLFLSYCACLLNRSIIWKPRYFDFRAWNPHLPKKFVNWTSSPGTAEGIFPKRAPCLGSA
jgi:hypothetical protein